MIYMHVLNRGGHGVYSPADRLRTILRIPIHRGLISPYTAGIVAVDLIVSVVRVLVWILCLE
jgi:hypothetical protein